MKRLTFILAASLAVCACGNGTRSKQSVTEEDMIEYGKIGYADIVSFLVQGFQCRWEGMSPEDQGLSTVYSYNSSYAGYVVKDINNDGIEELLIGDMFENGDYLLYDIYTINPDDGSLVHLADGGERDSFRINGDGIIIEDGSNSASDSFQKGYKLENGKLIPINGWEDSLLKLDIERFAGIAAKNRPVGACGEQREITDEEMEMFRKATAGDGQVVYTPLSVSTQVVAGTNYRFWCRFEDISDGIKRKSADDSDKYGYCWITIFKPLPGRGEARVRSTMVR